MDYENKAVEIIEKSFEEAKYRIINKEYENYFKKLRNEYKYLCVFGAGSLGNEMINMLKEFGADADFVCDNNFVGIRDKYKTNPKAISLEELCEHTTDCLVFVSPSNGMVKANDQINEQLRGLGFKYVIATPIWKNMIYLLREIEDIDKDYFCERVLEIISWCEDEVSKAVIVGILDQLFRDYRILDIKNDIEKYYDKKQYFVDIIKPRIDECFVDGGAFSGDTFETFYKWNNGVYEKYYGFELESDNREALIKNISVLESDNSKIEIFECGLFDKYEKVKIYSQNDASHIAGIHTDIGYDKSDYMEVRSMDECLSDKKVTFIKMDIENSEIPALYGARKIITKQKPLCAISVYHGLKQLIEVPGILKNMNPDYRIWYRIHSTVGHDIVCYAIDKNDILHMNT